MQHRHEWELGFLQYLKCSGPYFFQVLPHDLQGIPRAIVGSDCVGAVPKDGQGDGLRTASVSQLVLHAVAQGVHCQLLVCDDCAKALHQA